MMEIMIQHHLHPMITISMITPFKQRNLDLVNGCMCLKDLDIINCYSLICELTAYVFPDAIF